VLSGHTKPHDTEQQVQSAAITVDLMKEEVENIHDVYRVSALGCYTRNITPSTSPKFFTLVEETASFLKTLFTKCFNEEQVPLEQAATFDKSTGLLSYKTKVFGLIPAHLFPLPCALPSCAVVCSVCDSLILDESKKQQSRVRLKCGHIFHQMCLVPALGSMKLKLLYKEELKSLCRQFNVSPVGHKAVLLERLNTSLTSVQKQKKVNCPGCTNKEPAPSLKCFCHCCKHFIFPNEESIRLPCSHVVHSHCAAAMTTLCTICINLLDGVTAEVCDKAKKTFTREYVPSSTSDDEELDEDAQAANDESEKQENLVHYFGELALKAKQHREQRGSLPKLKIDKVSD